MCDESEMSQMTAEEMVKVLRINKRDAADPVLRELCSEARDTLGTASVIINFVGKKEQITVSGNAFDTGRFMEYYHMPREQSVCRIMIDEKVDDLEITDLRKDERTKSLDINKLSLKQLFLHKFFRRSRKSKSEDEIEDATKMAKKNQDDTLKFYYGAKLKVGDTVIGAVCALDTVPRPDWREVDKETTKQYAKVVAEYLLAKKVYAPTLHISKVL